MSPARPLASLASLALLTACAGTPPAPPPPMDPPPPPPPASAAPVVSAAPSAQPSASAAAAVEQAPLDPAADREAVALVSALCPAAIHHDHGKVQVGCRACPPFGAEGGKPDGKVAVDPPEFYPMEARYPGAFTAPGKDEIAVVFQGCEPHAANYGGTQLVEKSGGSYKAGAYYSGLHPESCKPYRRPDGRDLLVCRWADAHQGVGFSEVFSFDFTVAKPDDIEKGFGAEVKVVDNAFQLCMGVNPDDGVSQGSVNDYRFEDRNHDGKLDLVVELEHRHTAYSKALDKKIEKACKAEIARNPGDPASLDASKLLGKPVKESVELLWDGKGFKASAKTEKLLKELQQGL